MVRRLLASLSDIGCHGHALWPRLSLARSFATTTTYIVLRSCTICPNALAVSPLMLTVCMNSANHPLAASVLSLLQATSSSTSSDSTIYSSTAPPGGLTGSSGMRGGDIELEPLPVARTQPSRAVAGAYSNLERDSRPHRAISSGSATP